jgi:hypothetical protein
MASQGQAVARQQNRWLEGFVIALATAGIMITLGWGAFTALSAPSTVAPSKTTTQILQEPGLVEQRAGERGAAVTQPVDLPKLHPYVSIQPTVRELDQNVSRDRARHHRGERGMELPNGTIWSPAVSNEPTVRAPGTTELPNGTFWSPAVSVHPRGHSRGRD